MLFINQELLGVGELKVVKDMDEVVCRYAAKVELQEKITDKK